MNSETRGVLEFGTDSPTEALYEQSWAVIVGINDYGGQFTHLANARNDAQAIADLLQNTYGFEDDHVFLLLGEDATRNAILEWLRDKLPEKAGPNDRVIFFFAGHGTTRESGRGHRRGYLIPYGARRGRYSDYVDMSELHDACGWIPAKHIFLILDCCFSGVAAVASRAEPSAPPHEINEFYLKRITQRPAWQILTAGDTDDLAADSGIRPGHSAFTSALLAGLEGMADQNNDGLITASELANHIKPEVTGETEGRQSPFFNYLRGSGQGDFVFLKPGQEIHLKPAGIFSGEIEPILKQAPWLWAVAAAMVLVILSLGGLVWHSYNKLNSTQATSTAAWATIDAERITLGAESALARATADMILAQQTAQAIVHQVTATAVAHEPAPTQTAARKEALASKINLAAQEVLVKATIAAIAPKETAVAEKALTAEAGPAQDTQATPTQDADTD